MTHHTCAISVVTPTLDRPDEVGALLANLAAQHQPPLEVVLVDGAPHDMNATRDQIQALGGLPYSVTYIRQAGGTAIQRNIGIDAARGEFVAFIDDDILLEPDFFSQIIDAFSEDSEHRVGAIAGYITNEYLDPAKSPRWRWYRRLKLFSTYEPGKYDYATGYPINRNMQPPHDGVREIDFMGSNCAVWRREVFDQGLRFSPFFVDFGVVEDAHLALSARQRGWIIQECGRARCIHRRSQRGRVSKRRVAWKTAVNYRFLFVDIVPRRSLRQETRFWCVQVVDLARQVLYTFRRRDKAEPGGMVGKLTGILAAIRVRPMPRP